MRFEHGEIKIVLETTEERDTLIKGVALICDVLNDCIRSNFMLPSAAVAGFNFHDGLLSKKVDFFERIKDAL